MERHLPGIVRSAASAFALTAVALLWLGLRQSSWWTIAGGVGAALTTAWMLTDPDPEQG